MTAEEMGKVSNRMRLTFAIASVAFLAVLAISPLKDYFRPWKHYQKEYVSLAESRPDTKQLLSDFHPGIDQIWLPDMKVVDRCTTCHLGIDKKSLNDPSVPEPFRAHQLIPHDVKQWGCTICHRGQGPATEVAEAHDTTLAWEQPLLPARYAQASCGSCHRADIPETPKLDRGRELLSNLNCTGCHRLGDIQRPEMLGPDLTNIGTKVSRKWIYKWLKEPRTIVDENGNTVVDGYETEQTPRMPKFRLSDDEIVSISAYLSTLRSRPVQPYTFDPRVVAQLDKNPDVAQEGETRFREMFCSTCHSLAVTRGDQTIMIGGDIGPELTKVGSKVNPDWLLSWLRDPQGYLKHAIMPRYQWTDENLYEVFKYLTTSLTDPDLYSDVPDLGEPTQQQVDKGKLLFVEKGCASCHIVTGVTPQKDFGPDLSAVGAKNLSQLSFGDSKIPRNLVAYIRAKLTDPVSVNPAARMPQYHLNGSDLDAIATALLSMTGDPSTNALARLTIPIQSPQFQPAGAFGKIYDRYKCDVCHTFNGHGGTIAPDLSFEGSRSQRQWIIGFLKKPLTIRPTLTVRMPQFNFTDQEAATIADYLITACQSPAADSTDPTAEQYDPKLADQGKELYQVKFQCQACHTIGATGGYVGPSLTNAGNWLTPAWIKAWLRNPQQMVPGTIEPRRSFTDSEIDALTAYLMSLKQTQTAQPGSAVAGGGR